MIRALLTGGGFGLGVWLILRGWFPAPVGLKTRIARYNSAAPTIGATDTVVRSVLGRPALWLLRTTRGDLMPDVEADVAITGGDLQGFAIDKVKTAIGGMVLLPMILLAGRVIHSPVIMLALAVTGFGIGYLMPDLELKKKAAARREEFSEVLTGFISLVAVSISGGGGVNSAMIDTTSIGDGWCFEALRQSLDESLLLGETPWQGFERLGRRLRVVPLIELASALDLAGQSGARVVETLRARAESARERELSESLASAQKKSESMSIPIAAMLLGWFGFLGYPAVANLLGL